MNHQDEQSDARDGADFEEEPTEFDSLDPRSCGSQVSRREFVIAVGTVTGAVAIGVPIFPGGITTNAEARDTAAENLVQVKLRINGMPHDLLLDPRVTLLDLLREDLALTGTKKGCDHGQCGSCTVLANGRRINSCLSLAVVHDGEEISTIEGLSTGDELHPLQAAFLEQDGFQCGYCTPGQICSAVAMLNEVNTGAASYITADLTNLAPPDLTDAEIRERMSGNICRCGAYPGIVQAIRSVHEKR